MIYEVLFVIWAVLVVSLLCSFVLLLLMRAKWAIEDWLDDKSWQIYLDSQNNEPRHHL